MPSINAPLSPRQGLGRGERGRGGPLRGGPMRGRGGPGVRGGASTRPAFADSSDPSSAQPVSPRGPPVPLFKLWS